MKNANAKGFDKDRRQSSSSQSKSQDKGKKDSRDSGQYTTPSRPKCFGCQGFGHMKQECPTYLKSIRKSKALVPTLSDTEPKTKSKDSDDEGILSGFTTIVDPTKGIIETMVENHGTFCQRSERVEKLINGVNDPNFGALIDIGNFACADEDNAVATGNLLPYAKHIHAKDFHIKSGNGADPGSGFFKSKGGNYLRGSIIGQGNVPVFQCLKLIKNSGYDRFLSVEFEGMEDCVKGISTGLENLKKYLEIC